MGKLEEFDTRLRAERDAGVGGLRVKVGDVREIPLDLALDAALDALGETEGSHNSVEFTRVFFDYLHGHADSPRPSVETKLGWLRRVARVWLHGSLREAVVVALRGGK